MSLPSESAFGRRSPPARWRRLIRMAQRCPENWFGQQMAQLVRLLVLKTIALPVDLEIGAIRMRCHMLDNCSEKKFAFMPWRFDGRERDLLVRSLPHDGVFVDIGANVGIYTLTAAVHLGAKGRIVAFEPNPRTYERLCFNVNATRRGTSRWPRINVLPVGVADEERRVDLHLDAGNLGAASILCARVRSAGTVHIRCRPLMAVIAELSISRVDALKIDIEGAEDLALMPFLASARAEQLPVLLIVENSERHWRLDLPGALVDSGYTEVVRTRMNTVYRRDAVVARVRR